MFSLRPVCAWLSCSLVLLAQAPPPAQPADGLQPDWDMGVILNEMSAHTARLQPVLDRVDVKAWVQKGASETYASQLQSAKDQARSFAEDARALARNPEKLSACLVLYFRLQGMDQMIGSLVEAARRYQDAAIADQLAALSAENGVNRGRLQTYIVNLATQREQECAVMDREAQRCRSIVATQPAAPTKSNQGRKK